MNFVYTLLKSQTDPRQEQLDEVVKDFKEVFELFDKDGDGTITTTELDTVMRSLGNSLSQNEIQEMMTKVDKDGSGAIEFNEFLEMVLNIMKSVDVASEVREAFRMFDKNNDGFISAVELKTILASNGQKMSDHELDELIREADHNGDGVVNYEKFHQCWNENTNQTIPEC